MDAVVLNQIKLRLVQQFEPLQVYIFGSHAWGIPTDNSDLDIMVIIQESNLPPGQRDAMAHRCLRGIRIPMDIIVKTRSEFDTYADVKYSLEYKIVTKGKLIYG